MVWRKAYSTRIERNLVCPVAQTVSLDGSTILDRTEVWVAGFGFSGDIEQGVWWRLFRSDFPDDARVRRVYIFESIGAKELETVSSLVPPSEHERVYLVSDPAHAWRNTVRPTGENQGFATILEGGKLPVAMIGPPTEEAWEEFQQEWTLRT